MSAQTTKKKCLTLFRDIRKSGLEKRETGDLCIVRMGRVTEQVCEGPISRTFRANEKIGNPGQRFLCQETQFVENRGFSAKDFCISPELE